MIPVWIRIQRTGKNKKRMRLFLPIFLLWIVLAAFMIVLAPLILIASLILWPFGYGKSLLLFGPRLFSILFSLSGLAIQVENMNEQFFLIIK